MKNFIYTLLATFTLLFSGCTDAGKNQTVEANTEVFFDVSGVKADLGGKITKYDWEQIGSSADDYDITILNNGRDDASFISPNVSKETTLRFELTATESYKCKTTDDSSCKHRKTTDTVKITVTPEERDDDNDTESNTTT